MAALPPAQDDEKGFLLLLCPLQVGRNGDGARQWRVDIPRPARMPEDTPLIKGGFSKEPLMTVHRLPKR